MFGRPFSPFLPSARRARLWIGFPFSGRVIPYFARIHESSSVFYPQNLCVSSRRPFDTDMEEREKTPGRAVCLQKVLETVRRLLQALPEAGNMPAVHGGVVAGDGKRQQPAPVLLQPTARLHRLKDLSPVPGAQIHRGKGQNATPPAQTGRAGCSTIAACHGPKRAGVPPAPTPGTAF